MAPALSSNWKKLQAKIQQEGDKPQGQKRKQPDDDTNTTIHSPAKGAFAPRKKARLSLRRPQMGAAQSKISKPGASATLALLAEDHGISPEAISEAYGLGARDNSMLAAATSKPNEGLASNVQLGKYLAIDCEMVGVGEGGYEHALARVSVADFHGRQVYDSYVKPKEHVTDWRTKISGIAPKHMVMAREFEEVQDQVAELFSGRIIVGHDLRHDLEALKLDHPRKDIRDTAKFSGFKKYGHGPKPALRVLAREILGVEIQTGQHSSLEDARVAMLLFRKYKPAFDTEHALRYPDLVPRTVQPKVAGQPKKKKTNKKRRN
ncbi:ribonuclease H-like domain-containing protein [Coniella lustricola]|uniref:RNA exonuclease 4 n=1 Tax=Coniella lustricola TaxID=2025994 RepID=A0A2T3ABQ8_9PEZI|nr:ribonuclease H-like domain-containing protein [Coniella lustricola]